VDPRRSRAAAVRHRDRNRNDLHQQVHRVDARSTFGGTKNSGYGRELAGFGPRAFVNAKTVWIA
jgi:acyl-CoA reductase-like NAD-dependent aldehyde dehydrogenase